MDTSSVKQSDKAKYAAQVLGGAGQRNTDNRTNYYDTLKYAVDVLGRAVSKTYRLCLPESCCCCCFSYSAYWLPTRKKLKTHLHGGQSCSGSAEQEKKQKKSKSGSAPPAPRSGKINITRRIYISRCYAGRGYAGLGPSRVRTRVPSTRRLDQWVSLRKILRFRVR